MTVATSRLTLTETQRFVLPGRHSWEKFQAIQAATSESGVRLSYLDGVIEFMTLGERHESIKTMIGFLIELFLFNQGIEFEPVGSATRESEENSVSFEPDESYYLGEQREHPDLAIEVNITSGSPRKLERYKRFSIQEVWMWQNNQLSLYSLDNGEYQEIPASKLLPDLDITLLTECVLMPSRLQAIQKFTGKE
ncbi:Uma2 family endonuclease [[Limnothrix rosea] IAM M-220]|uniref:Uma2 family endonuclease n=1 Tax=[Limnothrix rosea] IAM M-220 TaxID=454133 RepID=UPI0009606DF6|nr:Uma2 family endonuclease [[Limnothrix rosea] IAM M-220]OKH18088.1 hypothetical protein NIES208_07015 [[Limnothrix rosea] IAM M-220]